MYSNEELVSNTGYWLDKIQNDLYYELNRYMKNKDLNRTQLAKELGFSKGYISQVLNGNFNYSLKKLIDLSLAIGLVPKINYSNVQDEVMRLNKLNQMKVIELKSENSLTLENIEDHANSSCYA